MRPKINSIPRHIAIIMDGNGRWAKKRFLPVSVGHTQGAKRVVELLDVAQYYDIEVVTLYAFSVENWKRDKKEIEHLMQIIEKFYKSDFAKILQNNVQVKFIGSREKIPEKTLGVMKLIEDESSENTGLILNIAFNYGGREEIVSAVNTVLGEENKDQITKEDIEGALYTTGQPDVDLLIRTSGEERVSNFLLWQIAYSEFVFQDILWPDFKEKSFIEALQIYSSRNRRFGGR